MEIPCQFTEVIFESSEGDIHSCVCGKYHIRWGGVRIRMVENEFIRLARFLKIGLGKIAVRDMNSLYYFG